MGSESPTVRLGDVCTKIGSGATPRGGKDSYLDDGPFTLVRSQNVLNNSFSWRGLAYISDKQAAALGNVELQPQDVLLNITGDSVARCCQLDPRVLPGRVNQHVAIIRPDSSRMHPGYLRYYLTSPGMQAHMLALASSGATRNAITKAMIESFEVPAPPLDEQRRIASLLGALDDKVELNRQMRFSLDDVAQAVFKSWFVDPVGPAWPSGGGTLPDGWSVCRLGDQVDIARGLSYAGSGLVDDGDGLPLHNLNSVRAGGGYKDNGLKWYSGKHAARHVVRAGDLIIANTDLTQNLEVIGSAAVIPSRFGSNSLFSHHLYRVRPGKGSPLTTTYLAALLREPRFHAVVAGFTNGTTVNMLPMDGLQMPRIIAPPAELLARFDQFARLVRERAEKLEDEMVTLRLLRDGLLPRLLSGALNVAGEAQQRQKQPTTCDS